MQIVGGILIDIFLELPKGERHRVIHLQKLVNDGGLDDLTKDERTVVLDAIMKQ